ncbi:MAG TPA: hypothetical protein VLA34_02235, partial [Candidatus Krumholzibacterium sp.]|nr:hypothetical protein [Candidatus Krumholzibacterium sp.]
MADVSLIHRMGSLVVDADDPEEIGAVDTGLGDVEGVPLEQAPGQLKEAEPRVGRFHELDGTVQLKAP